MEECAKKTTGLTLYSIQEGAVCFLTKLRGVNDEADYRNGKKMQTRENVFPTKRHTLNLYS